MKEFDPTLPNDNDPFSAEGLDDAIVSAIAYGAPLMPLPERLKSRLMERLRLPALTVDGTVDETVDETVESNAESSSKMPLEKLLEWSLEDLIAVAETIENWVPMPSPDKALRATWKTDPVNRQVAFFVRAPLPGALPTHYHATGETILVLQGDFISEGVRYQVGDRMYSAAGTTHQPTTTGCLVLGVSSMDDRRVPATV
jgi:ChrR Cupin-like domain